MPIPHSPKCVKLVKETSAGVVPIRVFLRQHSQLPRTQWAVVDQVSFKILGLRRFLCSRQHQRRKRKFEFRRSSTASRPWWRSKSTKTPDRVGVRTTSTRYSITGSRVLMVHLKWLGQPTTPTTSVCLACSMVVFSVARTHTRASQSSTPQSPREFPVLKLSSRVRSPNFVLQARQ